MKLDAKLEKVPMWKKSMTAGIAFGLISAALVVFELRWLSDDVRAVASSSSGHYAARVSTHYYGGEPWGAKVHLWPRWAPIPSLFAFQIFDAPCQAMIEWKSESELEILCPNPEGQPQLHSHPWAVKVTIKA